MNVKSGMKSTHDMNVVPFHIMGNFMELVIDSIIVDTTNDELMFDT